jgi:hypothetical protein
MICCSTEDPPFFQALAYIICKKVNKKFSKHFTEVLNVKYVFYAVLFPERKDVFYEALKERENVYQKNVKSKNVFHEVSKERENVFHEVSKERENVFYEVMAGT